MNKISLDGTWQLYYWKQGSTPVSSPDELQRQQLTPIPAQVPGNVELDLMRAGLLKDPYIGSSVLEVKPFERYEWWYERQFDCPGGVSGRTELVFHGADCIATYWLNGQQIGRSDNALIEHRIDVTGKMLAGQANKLSVRLQSVVLDAMERKYDPSMFAQSYAWEQIWSRKPAHSFSWDIMPRVVSAGLWRSVELVVHEENEIADVYLFTHQADEQNARIGFYYELKVNPDWLNDMKIRITGKCDESSFERTDRAKFVAGMMDVHVGSPKLWWPRGYGEPHLYDVTVQLLHDGAVIAEKSVTMGIRRVELIMTDTTSAENPGQFLFKVNGTPIMCKGSNWVPADMFHSKDSSRIERMLDLFADMNCNIVRCWGGNVYEDHAFFDRCDREGFMVWQDIALACGFYPETEPFYQSMELEVESVARKLRNHPSLIIWCGDNEIDQFKHGRNIDPNKSKLTRQVIRDALMRQDPYRAYLPSSPYISEAVWAKRDMGLLPENHLWGPRDYFKSRFYTEHTHHFVSEIGYHGCPNLSSIKQFIEEPYWWPWQNNEQWAVHASDPFGLGGPFAHRIQLMSNQVQEMFGHIPETIEDFVLASQICQAEAKKFFVEMTRLKKGKRSGVIWWNMIDGWPQFSDAVVDYYFGKKLAYHYLKRVHQDVCIMIDEPNSWHVRVVLGNDTRKTHTGAYRIWDADTNEVRLEGEFRTKANENVQLGQIRVSRGEQKLFLIQWTIDGVTYANHYWHGTPPASLDRYKSWLRQIAGLQSEFALTE